jgi:UDP-N-acetylglucosamine acyltransferase
MSNIHPTAIIGNNVKIGKDTVISPYAVIDGNIEIGDNVKIGPYVHICGDVKIANGCSIHSAAAIGEPPQDLIYDGTPGLIEIGENTVLREYVTIHTPIKGNEGEKTVVGKDCFLMANSHVGHNTKVGNGVIMANGALLAGFVTVDSYVFLSGNVAVHQFCRIGRYSIVGGLGKVVQDIPPFMTADGVPAEVHGLNIIGLRRGGFSPAERGNIKEAYKMLYSGKSYKDMCNEIETKFSDDKNVMGIVEVVRLSKRGIVGHYGKA